MRKLLIVLAVLVAAAGCATKPSDQRFMDEVGSLSKEEIASRGQDLYAKKRWEDARKYFSFLSDSFPNDPLGRQAALRVADTFYSMRDTDNLAEAQLRYRDFSNRFPSDPGRPYALLMLGKCSYSQRRGPLRDMTPVREAADSLRQVVQLFPDSPYTQEARELLGKCLEDLGQHEYLIAKYYASISAWRGAKQRLDYLHANYPDTAAAKQAAPLVEEVERKFNPQVSPPPTATPRHLATNPTKH
jgi:outer membrane protein assembly factor BamD